MTESMTRSGNCVCDHVQLEQTKPPAAVRVSRKGADRFRSGHPWIFRSDVTDAGQAAAGDTVQVLDPRGQLLGRAHYSASSQIALRMLVRSASAIDIGAPIDIGKRIAAAQAFREQIVTDSTAYRVVHAEADFLPALIIDRYGDCFCRPDARSGDGSRHAGNCGGS